MSITLRPKNTKFGALNFTKFLSQGVKTNDKVKDFEPPPQHGLMFDEGSAQSSILDYLLLEMVLGHLFVQRINNTPIYDSKIGKYRSLSKGQSAGFPDIFVMKKRRAIFFEVKSSTGRQSKDQIAMQKMLEDQDAEYYIVRSIDGVKRALDPAKASL